MHESGPGQCTERLAGVETHHEHLRRRQQSPSVEQVAQAAAAEPLAHHEEDLTALPGVDPVVEDGRQVGVVQLLHHRHDLPKAVAHLPAAAEVGVQHRDHDRALEMFVDGLERHGVGGGPETLPEPVTAGEQAVGRGNGARHDRGTVGELVVDTDRSGRIRVGPGRCLVLVTHADRDAIRPV